MRRKARRSLPVISTGSHIWVNKGYLKMLVFVKLSLKTVVSQFESSTRFNRRASLSLVCHLVDNLASVERVLGRGRSIGQRLFIDLAESHLVRTAPCLIPAQVDVMHDPI